MSLVAQIGGWLSGGGCHEGQNPTRRRKLAGRRRQGFRPLLLEVLESRRVLSIYPYGPILDGQVKSGTIAAAADQHVYWYQPTNDIDVTISLSSVKSSGNPRVGIYSGTYSASADPLATVKPGAKSSPPIHLTAGAYYEIAINDNSTGSGAYAVALKGVNPASQNPNPTTMNRGNVKAGKIDARGDVDEFTFTAPAGSKVTLSLAEPASGSNLRPHAQLYSPTGDEVQLYSAITGGKADDVGYGKKVISDVLAGGTYVVQVYDDNYTGTDTRDYRLAVEGLIAPSLDSVTILWGQTLSDTIDSGEIDEYDFLATAGDVVTVSLSELVPGTDTELWAELYSPSGEQVEKFSASPGGPNEVENGNKVVYLLPETGRYVIQVYDDDYTHTEAYAVTLEGLKPHSPDAQKLILGTSVSATGQISAMGEVDEIYFNLSAAALAAVGGTYTAKVTFDSDETANYKPKAMLFSPSGNKVGVEFGTGDTKTPVLTEAGDYVLQVYDNDYTDTSGELTAKGKNPNYTVTLQDAEPPAVVSVSASPTMIPDSAVGPAKLAITVTFSEAMDTSPAAQPSLAFSSVQVAGGSNPTLTNPVTSWNASKTIWSCTYDVEDRNVEIGNVTVDVLGAKDAAGNSQTNYNPEKEFDIDTKSPTVATSTPPDNATGVAVSADLVITFHEQIVKGAGNLVIKRSADQSTFATIPVTDTQVTVLNNKATINPSANFAVTTGYYVEADAGAFRDAAGNPFTGISGATSWNFTTAGVAPPQVINLSPPDNAVDVAVGANLVMTFNENVQKGAGDITLVGPGGNVASSVSFAGATVTIDPTSTLEYNTNYYVEVASGAVKSMAGVGFPGIAGPTAWDFTTEALAALPIINVLVSPSSVTENAANDLVFTFTRSVVTAADLTVKFHVDGTAASSDYSVRDAASFDAGTGSGTIVILAGRASASLRVDPVPDAVVEPDETVRVALEADANYAPGSPNSAIGTIRDTVVPVHPYHNADFPEDVNHGGWVSPLDVLIVINYINGQGAELPPAPVPPATPEYYYDVDADGKATANDVLIVINYLNSRLAGGEGESEAPSAMILQPASADRGPTGISGLASFLDDAAGLRTGSAASGKDATHGQASPAAGVLRPPAAPTSQPMLDQPKAPALRRELRLPRASASGQAAWSDEADEEWAGLVDLLARNAPIYAEP